MANTDCKRRVYRECGLLGPRFLRDVSHGKQADCCRSDDAVPMPASSGSHPPVSAVDVDGGQDSSGGPKSRGAWRFDFCPSLVLRRVFQDRVG